MRADVGLSSKPFKTLSFRRFQITMGAQSYPVASRPWRYVYSLSFPRRYQSVIISDHRNSKAGGDRSDQSASDMSTEKSKRQRAVQPVVRIESQGVSKLPTTTAKQSQKRRCSTPAASLTTHERATSTSPSTKEACGNQRLARPSAPNAVSIQASVHKRQVSPI